MNQLFWQSALAIGKTASILVGKLEEDEAKKNFAVKSNNMAVEATGKLSNV